MAVGALKVKCNHSLHPTFPTRLIVYSDLESDNALFYKDKISIIIYGLKEIIDSIRFFNTKYSYNLNCAIV